MSLLQHYLEEEFGFATAPLVASGYYDESMSFKHMPSWYCYSRSRVEKEFQRYSEHIINFMYFIAEELREIMAQLGFRTLKEMVGQSQLNVNKAIKHYKAV
jgi:glutamate synthase (ferredoxin)